MGKYDSSKTRVVPVFNALYTSDKTGKSWLTKLLSLAEHGVGKHNFETFKHDGLKPLSLGTNEKSLLPPRPLLEWLVCNPLPQPGTKLGSSRETSERRQALIRKESEMINVALSKLRSPKIPVAAWYVLEGPSFPDVFLETNELILVVEGKRTESGPTRSTSWMPIRDQMLRHIDSAWSWSERNDRHVFGMLVVEGEDDSDHVPSKWIDATKETTRSPILDDSLVHRELSQRQAMASAFLGVTTWQRICTTFGIGFNELPEFCDD